MEETSVFINLILSVAVLLFLSSVIAAFFRKIKIPYTVILVLAGIVLGVLSKKVEFFSFLNVLELSPELIFYVFLPVLIFESAYNIKFFDLKDNIATIASLSIFGLGISALLVGFLLNFGLALFGIELPFMYALLFGALISATDPIAVLSLFREMNIPKRLYFLFEGESLFNDGTAFVLFQIILSSVAIGGITVVSAVSGVEEFFYVVFAAMVFGTILGYIFSFTIGKIRNLFTVEITLTLILAHVTFIVAEHFLEVSGIIATVFAGLMVGSYGRSKISPDVLKTMEQFWVYGAFIVNSLIFLLIGLSIKNIDFAEIMLASLIAIIVVLFARTVSIMAIFPFINRFTKDEKTPFKWQVVMSWGGLRGALALAIVLILPEDFMYRDFILSLTLAVILFSLIIQATTIKKLVKRLKLDEISDEENFEREESFVFVDEVVRLKLKEMFANNKISIEVYDKLNNKYKLLEEASKKRVEALMKANAKIFSHDELVRLLKKQALGIEKRALYSLYSNFEISEYIYNKLNKKLEAQINRLKKNLSQFSTDEEKEFQDKLDKVKLFFMSKLSGYQLFSKYIEKEEVVEKITRYRMLRARSLTANEVILQLKKIKELHTFIDSKVLDVVIDQYRCFKDKNQKEIESMKEKESDLIRLIDYSIANNSSIRLEKGILSGLNKNGIVSDDSYKDISSYLDELIYKKSRLADRYFKSKKA